ncbi:MAG: hypothetical protein ACOX34_05035 [Bacillota bacterium]|nr:DUF4363 family protein [Candidatus Fermentithermobacillaceae bacterium]
MARVNPKQNRKQHKDTKHPKHHHGNQTWDNIQVIVGRLLLYGVPVIVLVTFVAILNLPRSGKQPKGRDDDVKLHLRLAQESVVAENWTQALTHIEDAENAWAVVIPRIQIGVQKGDIMEFTLSLARLKASAQCMDKPGCLRELAELFVYWEELGK